MHKKLLLFLMLLSAQLLAVMAGERPSASETGRTIQAAPTVRPNRTVPEVEAPKTSDPLITPTKRNRRFEQ
jgi:hypothetical protein